MTALTELDEPGIHASHSPASRCMNDTSTPITLLEQEPEKVEFMFGVGPEWIHTRAYGVTTNSLAAEVVWDFMFWPSPKRRFGWFLEPSYDYSIAH
jgi:hypothetical protein